MRICIVFILFTALLVVDATAQTTVPIVDGRRDVPWADLSAWANRPAFKQARAAAHAYWLQHDPSYEEEVRVLAVADGAFTRGGARQQAVLYAMSLWPRCCPRMGLAIIEGDRLVRNAAFEGVAQVLFAVPDLDGDGRDELFFTGSFEMGGEETRSLSAVTVGPDSLYERSLATIYGSTCATGMEGSGSTAARIAASPGPAFTIEQFVRTGCDDEAWQPVNGPEALALDPAAVRAYVDLPVSPPGD